MDEKQQNAVIAPAPGPKEEPVSSEPGKREFISRGEQLHQWGSYLSVDVVLNAISGVAFAYWGKYTDLGKKIWHEPVTNAATAMLRPFIRNEKSLLASVDKGRTFASIIAGGMLFTVPPLMLLENRRVKKTITQHLDRHIYGKAACENDLKFQKAYDEIGNEPKKGFFVGNLARYTALAPLLAVVLVPGPREASDRRLFKPLGRGLEKLAAKMGITPGSVFRKLPEAERQERWNFLRENAAMDVGLELPYAALHYAFYNMFAGMAARHKAKKGAAPHDVEAIAPVSREIARDVEKDVQAFGESRITPRPAGFTQREMPPAGLAVRVAGDRLTQQAGAAR